MQSQSKSNFERLEETIKLYKQHKPYTIDAVIHYSVDLAQQVHIPSNAMQPGLIYFTTPSKCLILGVMCKAMPQQVNWLNTTMSGEGKLDIGPVQNEQTYNFTQALVKKLQQQQTLSRQSTISQAQTTIQQND
ncbi:hypothetical protein ACROYT_G014707 [Oculina patagonica]